MTIVRKTSKVTALSSVSTQAIASRRDGNITAISIGGKATDADADPVLTEIAQRGSLTQASPDPFQEGNLYSLGNTGDLRIIQPPVSLSALMRMPNDNSILRQCIEAMVINTEGHGHRLEYIGPEGEEQSAEAVTEKEHIEAFLETLHPELSLTELRKRLRWDIETFGFAYMELMRDKAGLPVGITHVPAWTMRMTSVGKQEVPVKQEGMRFGAKQTTTIKRRFRRFVQLLGTEKVWFKEFGDPTVVDPKTGVEGKGLAHDDSATEIIMLKQYVPGQVYGMPRWYNNLVAIQGSRQAELTNLDYFKENAIPALAILVAGGYLHRETVAHIEEHVTAARGRGSQNRVLLLEVQGDDNAASKDGAIPQPRVDIKPMAGDRPQDGLFLEYDKAQTEKVRSSFRLPPIFTGHAQDYSHASAKTSYEVAEGQVFGPERTYIDDTINIALLKPYKVKFWAVRSNPPRISDPQEIIEAVTAFNEVGALTPNIAIGLANEQFGLNIQVIKEDWGNFPFAIVTALVAQGKIIGFEEILKEIDEADELVEEDDDANAPAVNDNEDDDDAKAAAAKTEGSRQIRKVMADLRTVLEEASVQRYSPPPRKRSKKAD